jgi:hypothetical protein
MEIYDLSNKNEGVHEECSLGYWINDPAKL